MCEIITAKSAGFCFGVERALKTVNEQIKTDDQIYTFGPIIHNEEVVNDLTQKGVKIINSTDQLGKNRDGTIIIRSHGVSEEVYITIKKSGLRIVDATCPFVKRIHDIVKKESSLGKQIIIIGDPNHPEVIGIKGWSQSEVIIVNNEEDAEKISLNQEKSAIVVSQTTFNYNKLKELVEIIEKKNYNVICVDTVCHATSERQMEAKEIAGIVDAMIVIGSFNSSNTHKLYEICKDICKDTFYVQTISDLDTEKLSGKSRIGITAGASTPKKIIEEVQLHVRTQFSRNA